MATNRVNRVRFENPTPKEWGLWLWKSLGVLGLPVVVVILVGRFQFRRGNDYGPHGDTHLRAVKQFEPKELVEGFDQASGCLLSALAEEALFRRPVTAAIDITTVPYYGDAEGMPMVSGLNSEERAFKFATLSIVGVSIPLVLAVELVKESSAWDENPPNQIHRVVRRLVR